MVKVKVVLMTTTQIKEFVKIVNTIEENVYLEDNAGHRVNAKSILGCLYSVEFDELYCCSEYQNLSNKLLKFLD